MTRSPRTVISGVPHHVTQRGNRREAISFDNRDQEVYRDLLAEQARKAGIEVWAVDEFHATTHCCSLVAAQHIV